MHYVRTRGSYTCVTDSPAFGDYEPENNDQKTLVSPVVSDTAASGFVQRWDNAYDRRVTSRLAHRRRNDYCFINRVNAETAFFFMIFYDNSRFSPIARRSKLSNAVVRYSMVFVYLV